MSDVPQAPRRVSWCRVPIAALLLAIALLGVLAAPASAHASLVDSDPDDGAVLPSAPRSATLRFDEPVRAVAGGLRLQAPDGRVRVLRAEDDGPGTAIGIALPQGLASGTYLLAWRVLSDDGHPEAGLITFSVGTPTANDALGALTGTDRGVAVVQSVLRGVGAAALLIAGGLVLLLARTARGLRLPREAEARAMRVLGVSAATAVATALLVVPVAGAYRRGSGLGGIADGASWSPALVGGDVLVLGLQALGLAAALAALRGTGSGRHGAAIAIAGAAVAVWSPALVGHTRAYAPSALLVLTDALHLSAGAAWLGGLVGLVLLLPAMAGRPRDAAALLTRFSSLAAGLLLALSVAGLLLGWRILGSWSGLGTETYGRLLLAKIVLAAGAALVAAHNRWRLLPRVAGDDGHAAQREATVLVARTVRVEVALLVVAAVVTGFLTQAAP